MSILWWNDGLRRPESNNDCNLSKVITTIHGHLSLLTLRRTRLTLVEPCWLIHSATRMLMSLWSRNQPILSPLWTAERATSPNSFVMYSIKSAAFDGDIPCLQSQTLANQVCWVNCELATQFSSIQIDIALRRCTEIVLWWTLIWSAGFAIHSTSDRARPGQAGPPTRQIFADWQQNTYYRSSWLVIALAAFQPRITGISLSLSLRTHIFIQFVVRVSGLFVPLTIRTTCRPFVPNVQMFKCCYCSWVALYCKRNVKIISEYHHSISAYPPWIDSRHRAKPMALFSTQLSRRVCPPSNCSDKSSCLYK